MLQNKFEMPLDLVIKPSKIFYSYFVVVFMLALISIFISIVLPLYLRLILFFLLLLNSLLIIQKQNTNHITLLKLKNNANWELEINNECYEVELHGECIVTSFLIWLNFSGFTVKGKKKVFHLLLFSDSADKDLLRQLRVRLRFLLQNNKEEETSAYT